jgi:hypothetical protein
MSVRKVSAGCAAIHRPALDPRTGFTPGALYDTQFMDGIVNYWRAWCACGENRKCQCLGWSQLGCSVSYVRFLFALGFPKPLNRATVYLILSPKMLLLAKKSGVIERGLGGLGELKRIFLNQIRLDPLDPPNPRSMMHCQPSALPVRCRRRQSGPCPAR